MSTKNNPGKFDCYTNAEPDEPMFILLARDPLAPVLVEVWAQLREARDDSRRGAARADEAMLCAAAMRKWKETHRDK